MSKPAILLAFAAMTAASLTLPGVAQAQSTDPNVRAIEQGAPVYNAPDNPAVGDPNINAIIEESRPLYNYYDYNAAHPGRYWYHRTGRLNPAVRGRMQRPYE